MERMDTRIEAVVKRANVDGVLSSDTAPVAGGRHILIGICIIIIEGFGSVYLTLVVVRPCIASREKELYALGRWSVVGGPGKK